MPTAVLYDDSSEDLAREVARELGASSFKIQQKLFPDGEQYVRIPQSLSGLSALYITRLYPNQDSGLVRVMLVAEAARGAGAQSFSVAIPYMPYARQDRRFLDGEPVSIDVVLTALRSLGIEHLYVIDIHKPQVLEKYPGFINIRPFRLYADGLRGIEKPVVVSPDLGSLWRARELADALGAEYGYIEKHRDRVTGEVKFSNIEVNVKDRDVIIVDDIISTGGTIVGAARILKEGGARRIYVVATHCLMLGDAEARVMSVVDQLYCSNTVVSKYSRFDVAGLISEHAVSG